MAKTPFVVLEGLDGAGTTTQTKLLVERLTARGIPAIATHEPTSGPIGTLIRRALRHDWPRPEGELGSVEPPSWATLALLFAADRLEHLQRVVDPALAQGKVVVSDRYDLSTKRRF